MRSTLLSAILTATIVLAPGGCAMAGESARVKELLGEQARAVLAAPDRVEVFRIAPQWEKKPGERNFAGYPLLAEGKEQGKDYAVRLAGILRDDQSYVWDAAKACEFGPGVGYRIWNGKQSIIVLVCFQCDEVGIIGDPVHPEKITVHDADPARPALLKLARLAFPDDKSLAGLKD